MGNERSDLVHKLARAVEEFAAQPRPDVLALADVADAAAAISACAAQAIHRHLQPELDASDEVLTAVSDIELTAGKLARAAHLVAQSEAAENQDCDE